MPLHDLAVWTARHSNGWITRVTANPDGTFTAGALPPGDGGYLSYLEMDEPTARAAAVYSLATQSGHTSCDAGCSDWEFHIHTIDV
jgi:hypothetical protein